MKSQNLYSWSRGSAMIPQAGILLHPAGKGVDEIAEALVGDGEVVVRHLEHVFARTGDLSLGVAHALLDDLLRVCSAPLEAAAKLLHVGREDEDVDVADLHRIVVRQRTDVLAHLRRALHVYVEYDRIALGKHLLDRRLERSVVVVVHLRVLDEGVLPDQLLEALLRLEVVVEPVLLVASRLARCAGDGVDDVAVLLQEHVYQSGLPAAGRSGENDEKRLGLHG